MMMSIPLYFSKVKGQWIISRTLGGNEPMPVQKIVAAQKVTPPASTKSSDAGEEEGLYQTLENFYAQNMSKEQAREVVGNIKNGYATMNQEQRLQSLKALVQQMR